MLVPWRVLHDSYHASIAQLLCVYGIFWREKKAPKQLHMMRKREVKSILWEPTTRKFRGYDPYIEGLKLSFFMVLGSKGLVYLGKYPLMTIP